MSYWFNILLRINIQNTIQCILLIIIQNRNRVHYVSNSFSLDQQLQTELTTQWATLRCSSKRMCCSWFILIHSFKQNHFQISLFNQFSLFNFLSTSSTSSIIKILLNQWIIKMVQYLKKRVVKIYCDSVFRGFAVFINFFCISRFQVIHEAYSFFITLTRESTKLRSLSSPRAYKIRQSKEFHGCYISSFKYLHDPAGETVAKYPTWGDLSSLRNKMVIDDPVDV